MIAERKKCAKQRFKEGIGAEAVPEGNKLFHVDAKYWTSHTEKIECLNQSGLKFSSLAAELVANS